MKINIFPIIIDHFKTLRNHRSGRLSKFDIFIFYCIPLFFALIPKISRISFRFDTNFYSLSITFFGVFIALLLNIQVAIFSIFQRKWEKPKDEHLASLQIEKLKERRSLLGELNSNLSYIILISCFSLFTFLICYIIDKKSYIPTYITYCIYIHFFLTLFMTVKRAHILFQMEYDGNN